MPLSCLFVAALALPQGPVDVVRHWEDRLATLARPDGRHGTLGPTGNRLWATRVEPTPGFVGDFHYLHRTADLTDPLTVEFTDGKSSGLPLEFVAAEWQPSHGTVEYTVGDGSIVEERWITEDDVLVARFTVRGVPELGVRWTSPLAQQPAGNMARFAAVPLAGFANADLVRSPDLRRGDPRASVYLEAEAPLRQVGSEGAERRAEASGGFVLGRDFGSVKGHETSYQFTATGEGSWTLIARYARGMEAEAAYAVSVRGMEVGQLRCSGTGGWGDAEEHYALQRVDLGEIREGIAELRLTASADGATTNFDGFFLVPTEQADATLPPKSTWPLLDPMRGAVVLPGGNLVVDGVPFAFLPPMGPQGIHREGEVIPVPGDGNRLHVLAVPVRDDASIACGEEVVGMGPRNLDLRRNMVSIEVPPGDVELVTRGCILLAATREDVPPQTTSHVRRGHRQFHGVSSEVRVGLYGLARPWRVAGAADGTLRFHFAVELCGVGVPGAATERALAARDTLAAHRRRYAGWFAARAPRLHAEDPFLDKLWTYRWFLLRHNMVRVGTAADEGPLFYASRYGNGRFDPAAASDIVREARWLADPALFAGSARRALSTGGVGHGIGRAVVDAFRVHPDRAALAGLLPALARAVERTAAVDTDADGLVETAANDAPARGAPSYWAHLEYDRDGEPAVLERPDANALHYGSASAVAEAADWLGRSEVAARMIELAQRTRGAVLAEMWDAEDSFFYALGVDGARARCKEVAGFYPFAFGLVPAEPTYDAAWRPLFDPEVFWSAMPVATCSPQVPGFDAQAGAWNGAVWPGANAVVAEAMARALREKRGGFAARQLGHLMQRFGLMHCEGGDPDRLLLREYGSGVTGEMWGAPDSLHGSFNDLFIRHAAGLVPRFDDVLEVRPLDVRMGDFAVEDIPYHGHWIGIEVRGDDLFVRCDGEELGRGSTRRGMSLQGFLR